MSLRRSTGVALTGHGIIVDKTTQNPPTRCATRVQMYVHKTYNNERYRAKLDVNGETGWKNSCVDSKYGGKTAYILCTRESGGLGRAASWT
jgi:hypothetical protein